MESGKFADYQPQSVTSLARWIDEEGDEMMMLPEFFAKPEEDLTLTILQASYDICLKAYGSPSDPRMDGPRERLEAYKKKSSP